MLAHKLSPLAASYLSVLLAAQAAERAHPKATGPSLGLGSPGAQPEDISEETDPPLTEEEVVSLAVERGLAEMVHLATMPASRSQKIPLHWDTHPIDESEILVPSTGPANALRAVRRHRPCAPKR